MAIPKKEGNGVLPFPSRLQDVWVREVTWQHKMLSARVPSAALKLAMYTLGYLKFIGQILFLG